VKTKWSIGLAALFAMLLVAGPAMADMRVGYVDIAKLLEESPQARSASERLQREFEPMQREIMAKREQMQQLQERITRDEAVLSDERRREKEREIRDLQRELQRLQSDFSEDVNARRNEAQGSLQRLILSEVQTFARDREFDLLVGDGVFYASSRVDVTDDILERLRRRHERERG
jgi:outer membrane protein